jgi:hypothetical protein
MGGNNVGPEVRTEQEKEDKRATAASSERQAVTPIDDVLARLEVMERQLDVVAHFLAAIGGK